MAEATGQGGHRNIQPSKRGRQFLDASEQSISALPDRFQALCDLLICNRLRLTILVLSCAGGERLLDPLALLDRHVALINFADEFGEDARIGELHQRLAPYLAHRPRTEVMIRVAEVTVYF